MYGKKNEKNIKLICFSRGQSEIGPKVTL